jgi:hypothetical protein
MRRRIHVIDQGLILIPRYICHKQKCTINSRKKPDEFVGEFDFR